MDNWGDPLTTTAFARPRLAEAYEIFRLSLALRRAELTAVREFHIPVDDRTDDLWEAVEAARAAWAAAVDTRL